MKAICLTLAVIFCWSGTSLARIEVSEIPVQLDVQRPNAKDCRNFDRLLIWGHNLEMSSTQTPDLRMRSLLYAGVEPVDGYYAPRPQLTGSFRFGGQRGDRVWLVPSKANPQFIDTIVVDPRIFMAQYCVYTPSAPIPVDLFK